MSKEIRKPTPKVTITEAQVDSVSSLIMPIDGTVEIQQDGEDILFYASHSSPPHVIRIYPSGQWLIDEELTVFDQEFPDHE